MTKRNVLIIGAGGVAHVAAHKAAMHNDELGDICYPAAALSLRRLDDLERLQPPRDIDAVVGGRLGRERLRRRRPIR